MLSLQAYFSLETNVNKNPDAEVLACKGINTICDDLNLRYGMTTLEGLVVINNALIELVGNRVQRDDDEASKLVLRFIAGWSVLVKNFPEAFLGIDELKEK